MKTSDFDFELPQELIAQHPPAQRGQSRLLLLDRVTGKSENRMVNDLPSILSSAAFCGKSGKPPLLVFNNSKVRKARLLGKSIESGAAAEFLLLEKLSPTKWKTLAQRAKRRKPGTRYAFYDANDTEIARAEIVQTDNEVAHNGMEQTDEGQFRILEFDRPVDDAWLDLHGHIPLPPYIKRADESTDADRYQTIYAAITGSAAAPTAGLHFTQSLLDGLAAAGIGSVFVTLHVGLGTFLPVRSINIEDHIMHEEHFTISDETADAIESAKAEGRLIIAVGTTSLRTLESAWADGKLKRGQGATSIFIYPGYRFNVVDSLFTNFHTPQSTLLMLVSAFAGRESILATYAEAVKDGYRFFSYGDAMLIR